jgi:menaquinol-cytochrome c reductase cytochrome b/c subunit
VAHDQHSNDQEKVVFVGDSRVRKKTKVHVPQDYSSYPGKSEAFVPNFLLKEWMVGAVAVFGYMVLTVAHPAPLGYPADPTNTAFIPVPDWYFLFLYQLLKYPYTSQDYVVFGTVVLPGLLFGALTLAPFLDTGKERRFYKRPIGSSLMLLSIASVIYLTVVSWNHYQHELEVNGITPEHIERAELLLAGKETKDKKKEPANVPIVAEDETGFDIYSKATCIQCHGTDLKGNPAAGMPSLRGIGDTYSAQEIMDIINNGIGNMVPQRQDNLAKGLTEEELNTLAEWLGKQKAPAAE